jgi:hypothetical protein
MSFHSEYNYEKRVELLLKWAGLKACKWLNIELTKKFLIEYMKDKSNLPTPLTITSFCIQSSEMEGIEKLEQLILVNSRGIPRVFAEEIRALSDDKIVFLSMILVSEELDLEFIARNYTLLMQDLVIKNSWTFGRILDWFKDRENKITLGTRYDGKQVLRFVHPSFNDSLEYLLVENNFASRIAKEFFPSILAHLADDEIARPKVITIIARYFIFLPQQARHLLFDLVGCRVENLRL